MVPHPPLPRVLNWQILLPGSILMCGFAFQVDRLVAEIEDHQLLHELSLEDDISAEELPHELDLSLVSSDSPMSGVAPLPPDPTSHDPVQESGVVRLPPDELDCGELENIPVPTACSTPICPLAPPVPVVSQAKVFVSTAIQSSFPVLHSDTSCSSESFAMDQEQCSSVEADVQGQEGPGDVEPNSRTVESEVLQDTLTALLQVTTEAVIHPSPSGVVSPPSESTSGAMNLPRTPQHVLPALLQEAASSDVLSAAEWSEDPALTIQESVLGGSPSHSSDKTSAISGALSTPMGSNHAPVDGVTVSDEAVRALSPVLSVSLVSMLDSSTEGPTAGHPCDQGKTDGHTHPVFPSTPADAAVLLPGSSILDRPASSSLPAQDLHLFRVRLAADRTAPCRTLHRNHLLKLTTNFFNEKKTQIETKQSVKDHSTERLDTMSAVVPVVPAATQSEDEEASTTPWHSLPVKQNNDGQGNDLMENDMLELGLHLPDEAVNADSSLRRSTRTCRLVQHYGNPV